MNLTELHPAFRIRQAGDGFVIFHWDNPHACGCLVRSPQRCWEMVLWGCEYQLPTAAAVIRFLNSRV
jgi:hypothetical protein